MIDTIRLKLPLTPLILRQIHESSKKEILTPGIGQKFFAPLVIKPHNRELTIIKEYDLLLIKKPSKSMYFYVEGSIPNLEQGENVRLFDPQKLPDVFMRIEAALIDQYGAVPPWREWEVQRVDPVYAWKFPNKGDAAKVLDFFQTLLYSRKKKRTYGDETVIFLGPSFSIQLYLKELEFKKHGYKKLIELGEIELANRTLELSREVLRYEIRMFKGKLQTSLGGKKIITCNDILDPAWYINILNESLTKLLKTPNQNNSSDLEAIFKLKKTYKQEKATRLFYFWTSYYSDEKRRKIITQNVDPTTISRSMKEISDAGVGIPSFDDVSKGIELTIPSENVVNPVSASVAIATEHD
jgi:hypothetical protein